MHKHSQKADRVYRNPGAATMKTGWFFHLLHLTRLSMLSLSPHKQALSFFLQLLHKSISKRQAFIKITVKTLFVMISV